MDAGEGCGAGTGRGRRLATGTRNVVPYPTRKESQCLFMRHWLSFRGRQPSPGCASCPRVRGRESFTDTHGSGRLTRLVSASALAASVQAGSRSDTVVAPCRIPLSALPTWRRSSPTGSGRTLPERWSCPRGAPRPLGFSGPAPARPLQSRQPRPPTCPSPCR